MFTPRSPMRYKSRITEELLALTSQLYRARAKDTSYHDIVVL